MKSFVQPGHVMTVTAPADTNSGDFVIVGAMFGIATGNALAGTDLELAIGGVHDGQPKTSAQAWTQGAALYFDTTAKVMTTVSTGGNIRVGVAALPAANPSATGRVRLNASF